MGAEKGVSRVELETRLASRREQVTKSCRQRVFITKVSYAPVAQLDTRPTERCSGRSGGEHQFPELKTTGSSPVAGTRNLNLLIIDPI